MALLGVVGPLSCSANPGAYVDIPRSCSGVMFLVMSRMFFRASAAITGSAVEGVGVGVTGVTGVGVVGPSAIPLPSGKSDMGTEKTGATGVGVVGPSPTPLPSGKSDMGAEKTGATGAGLGVGTLATLGRPT